MAEITRSTMLDETPWVQTQTPNERHLLELEQHEFRKESRKQQRADLVAYRHTHPKLITTRATTLTMRRKLKMLRENHK